MLSYLQAAVIGLLQGVTEMFPVSSLGHSVLVPALLGGSWEHLVTESSGSASETSPYLAFIVALHVATALALIIFFRADWARIIARHQPLRGDDGRRPRPRPVPPGRRVLPCHPVILAAGVLKLPTLAGPAAAHIHGPVILGAVGG